MRFSHAQASRHRACLPGAIADVCCVGYGTRRPARHCPSSETSHLSEKMRTSKLSTLAAAVLLLGGTNLAIAAGHKGRSKRAAYPRGKQSLASRIASSTRIIGVAAMCGRRAAGQQKLHPEAKPRPHTSLAVNAGQVGLFGLARARALSAAAFMASCKGVCAQHDEYMLSRSRGSGPSHSSW
jgi:hypothetical protein